MPITALYAALLTPLFLLLSKRVIEARKHARVGVGDGGDSLLMRRIRVHANFAEYVPLALILLACAESVKTPAILMHCAGVVLVFSRCLHAYGVSQEPENFKYRIASMMMTLGVLSILALACVWGAL